MSDMFHGSIEILKARYPKHIWEKMKELAGNSFEESIFVYRHEDATARNGEFPELEDFLAENGIPFDRKSEGFCEIHPEKRIFRPHLLDKTIMSDNEGCTYITTDELKDLLNLKIPSEEILDKIQSLVDEKDPQYPDLAHYTIMWVEGENVVPFIPDEETEENDNVRVVAVLGDLT